MKRIGGQMLGSLKHHFLKIWDASLLAMLLLAISLIASFYPGYRWLGIVVPGLLLGFPKWWENCLLSLPITLLSVTVILVTIGNYLDGIRNGIQAG